MQTFSSTFFQGLSSPYSLSLSLSLVSVVRSRSSFPPSSEVKVGYVFNLDLGFYISLSKKRNPYPRDNEIILAFTFHPPRTAQISKRKSYRLSARGKIWRNEDTKTSNQLARVEGEGFKKKRCTLFLIWDWKKEGRGNSFFSFFFSVGRGGKVAILRR